MGSQFFSEAKLRIKFVYFSIAFKPFIPTHPKSGIWFSIFCCTVTGAVDLKILEDYSTTSFVLAFIRFSCTFGYPKKLMPDAGSQLLKACTSMSLTFRDIQHKLSEYGVDFEPCPVHAHYMHGKVERKIRHVKETFSKHLQNQRLSLIQ